jgi:antitoxin ParD1/3/4
MATMNVSLPDEMKAWVDQQVANGRYANASDAIRDFIRRDQVAVAKLQALIDEGRNSGVSDLSLEEIVAEARKKALAAVKARDAAA